MPNLSDLALLHRAGLLNGQCDVETRCKLLRFAELVRQDEFSRIKSKQLVPTNLLWTIPTNLTETELIGKFKPCFRLSSIADLKQALRASLWHDIDPYDIFLSACEQQIIKELKFKSAPRLISNDVTARVFAHYNFASLHFDERITWSIEKYISSDEQICWAARAFTDRDLVNMVHTPFSALKFVGSASINDLLAHVGLYNHIKAIELVTLAAREHPLPLASILHNFYSQGCLADRLDGLPHQFALSESEHDTAVDATPLTDANAEQDPFNEPCHQFEEMYS